MCQSDDEKIKLISIKEIIFYIKCAKIKNGEKIKLKEKVLSQYEQRKASAKTYCNFTSTMFVNV
jgi:hypothetical protein